MANDMMPWRQYEILPDVTLTVLPTDRFKVGMLSLSFVLPFSRQDATARSLLFSVLRRGCRRYPSMADINRRLDELYATPYRVIDRTRDGYQYVGFGAELLETRYLLDKTDLCREVLTLMSEMLFHPLTDENGLLHERYVEQEKKNAIDYLRSRKNHPSSYAMARFLDAFRDDDPFSLPLIQGAEDRVRAITPERLTQLWQELLRCAPIHLFYVGGLPAEQLVESLRSVLGSAFAGVGRMSRPVTACPRLALPSRRELRRLQEQGEEGQSHLILGFRSGVTLSSPDYYAMMLCHELLGQSPISRLFVHVREAHSLCYSCFSMYGHERGEVIVSCGISAENRDRAEQAILEQIEVLKRGDFSQAEWVAAKKSLIGSCRQLEDSTNGLANFYEKRIRLWPNHTIEEYVTRYQALTREDVMAVAKKLCPDMIYFRQGMGRDEQEEEGTDE